MSELHKLVKERAVAYNPAIARELGSITAGLLMCQLAWIAGCLRKGTEEWFYKTVDELKNELAMSRHEQDNARKILLSRGWINTILKGVPAKIHYCITDEFNEWCHERNENVSLPKSDKLDCDRHESDKLDCRKTANLIAEEQQTITKSTTKKPTNKTSLSVCKQTDCVEGNLIEAEICLPKHQITKGQLIERWNKIAEKHFFKTHRLFNTAWEKNLAKANKAILDFSKDGWEEFFRCVGEVMNSYKGTEYVKYFDVGFALRPEKFQNIMEDNVRFPHRYDKAIIKKIVAGLKAKNDKVAEEIRWYEGRGDKKLMRKKHKRWIANREAIAKWQEILTGEQK